MPFQSEKQRRYLHANHPEIAKRWEKEYANGGILDINASEEIISDDGNEIELTDYNAAFDDPNDFSNGVKSLFRAKDGGNIRLQPHTATDLLAKKNPDGTRSKYQPPGHRDAPAPSSRGPRDDPDRGGPVQTVTPAAPVHDYEGEAYGTPDTIASLTTTTDDKDDDARSQYLANLTYPKRYKPVEIHTPHTDEIVTTQIRDYYDPRGYQKRAPKNEKERSLLDKIAWGIAIFTGVAPFLGIKIPTIVTTASKALGYRKDIDAAFNMAKKLGLIDKTITVDQFAEKFLKDLKLAKELEKKSAGLGGEEFERLTYADQLKLLQSRDKDEKGDGDEEIPSVERITEELTEATEAGDAVDIMSVWDRIKQGQAKRSMLVEQGIIQGEPMALANSGGLANLFRVKNQY
jgi:hypothetical protein